MTLTEKWKKGELPSRDDEHEWLSYYIKHNDGYIHADSYWRGKWGIADRNSIAEVLAPVPSYEELQEKQKSLKVLAEAYCKEKEENKQLKDLLKECKHIVSIEKDFASCHFEKDKLCKLLTKINSAIGESEE